MNKSSSPNYFLTNILPKEIIFWQQAAELLDIQIDIRDDVKDRDEKPLPYLRAVYCEVCDNLFDLLQTKTDLEDAAEAL